MCKFTIPQVDSNATTDERRKAYFDALYSADLSEEVEKKNGLSYISWSQAWKVMKEFYPSATYKIHTCPTTGLPYFVDPQMGIMVHTEVTADELTYENWLPVLDFSNRSQLAGEAYTVQVYDKFKKQYFEKQVDKADSFSANSAIQRSLCKCMAMHGLALKLYSGLEMGDENSDSTDQHPKNQKQNNNRITPQIPVDPFAGIKHAIDQADSVTTLMSIYLDHQGEIESNPSVKKMLTNRKLQLQQAA